MLLTDGGVFTQGATPSPRKVCFAGGGLTLQRHVELADGTATQKGYGRTQHGYGQ